MKKIKSYEYKEYEDSTITFFYKPDNWDNAHTFLLDFLADVGFSKKEIFDELDIYLGDIKSGLYYFFEKDITANIFFCGQFIYMSLHSRNPYTLKNILKTTKKYLIVDKEP